MKKRLVSFLLVLALVLTMIPVLSASALAVPHARIRVNFYFDGNAPMPAWITAGTFYEPQNPRAIRPDYDPYGPYTPYPYSPIYPTINYEKQYFRAGDMVNPIDKPMTEGSYVLRYKTLDSDPTYYGVYDYPFSIGKPILRIVAEDQYINVGCPLPSFFGAYRLEGLIDGLPFELTPDQINITTNGVRIDIPGDYPLLVMGPSYESEHYRLQYVPGTLHVRTGYAPYYPVNPYNPYNPYYRPNYVNYRTTRNPVYYTNELTSYTDTANGDWFFEAAEYCRKMGIMGGVAYRAFGANVLVNRGTVMTALARLGGVNTENSYPWYQRGMEWCRDTGISTDGNPLKKITREQAVYMLYRYAKFANRNYYQCCEISGYSDYSALRHYAREAMAWAVAAKIVRPENNKLCPQALVSRAELAQMMMNLCLNA